MAKIIKPAAKVRQNYRTKCQRCKATIEFEKSELKMVPDSRDGNYYEAKCPSCNNLITIAAELVP